MNESKPTYKTFDEYKLLSLAPAPAGAMAIYCDNNGLYSVPVRFVGTAEVTSSEYKYMPGDNKGTQIGHARVYNVVVAVEYSTEGGFEICEEIDNFCGVALSGADIPNVSYSLDGNQHEMYKKGRAAYLAENGISEQ